MRKAALISEPAESSRHRRYPADHVQQRFEHRFLQTAGALRRLLRLDRIGERRVDLNDGAYLLADFLCVPARILEIDHAADAMTGQDHVLASCTLDDTVEVVCKAC